MKFPPRAKVALPEPLLRHLNVYGMSATAAGVGLLALVQPAEAKIVYTAAHHVFDKNMQYNLDLNHDGNTDFALHYNYQRVTSGTIRSIYAQPAAHNAMVGHADSREFLAAALPRGLRIPNGRHFGLSRAVMAYQCDGFIGSCAETSSQRGNWFNTTNRYLGLKFLIRGKTHYGWARLSIQYGNFTFVATLTGYAYETIPDKSIVTGETKGPDETAESVLAPLPLDSSTPNQVTLGALALGAHGIPIWRREEVAPESRRTIDS